MSEYTPTTAEVRAAWSAWYEPGDDRWAPERFDRWLAAHDAELAGAMAERDAQNGAISTLSHTLSEQQQDIEKRDQRIRDLEAEVERLRGAVAAVRDLTEHLMRLGFMRVEESTQTIRRKLDAILADTDEGQSNGD